MKLFLLFFLTLQTTTAVTLSASVLLDLDAADLKPSSVREWRSKGVSGADFTANVPSRAENVQGRMAVVFDGTKQFIGGVPLPAGMEKGKPFTIEVWALNPIIEKAETLVVLARPPGGPGTEFNFATGSSAGAFRSGFKATTPYASLPSANVWHHLAWTYSDADGGKLRVYVDGELNVERAMRIELRPQPRIYIGASAEVDSKGPKKGFSGAIARVRMHDAALTQSELREAAGLLDAYAPMPRNAATTNSLSVDLHWEPGSKQATSYALYLDTDRAKIERSDKTLAKPSTAPSFGPVTLRLGATYFWRVAQLRKNGEVLSPGVVWSFTADQGLATKPVPRDSDSNVEVTLNQLTWQPGKYTSKQSLFMATSLDELTHAKPVTSDLAPSLMQLKLHAPLNPGTRYYWRVDSENGTQPPTRGHVWTFRTQDTPIRNDITFFVGSDTHYGRENNAAINRRIIAEMNALPGTPLPDAVGGGIVRTPRGVILNGDLLDEGFDKATAPPNWAEFCHDYGLTGKDGLLCFPVYEGFGNHDGGPTKSFVRAGIKERNVNRVGLKAVSRNGLHYSWEWDNLHLAQLNLFGGSGPADVKGVNGPEHDPEQSLEFLKYDLTQNVGNSRRPVITFQHFAWLGGMSDWWHLEAKERFREVVKPYNVPCLINGHSHGASFLPWGDLLTIHNGSTARGEADTGDFLVVRVTEKELIVIQRKLGEWGIHMRKPLNVAASTKP